MTRATAEPYSPDLVLAIQKAAKASTGDVRVSLPAQVVTYNAATQTANVQPCGKEGGQALPIITSVPVLFPQGGGFSWSWPLTLGDHVWVLLADRDVDRVLSRGGQWDPASPRRFSLSDAVCIAGFSPIQAPLTSASATNVVLRLNAVAGQKISIGNGTDELLDIVDQLCDILDNATFGGFPLDPASKALIVALKASLANIKV